MAQDKLYRLLTGTHTRNEGGEVVTYRAGAKGKDLIRLSADKASRMGVRVQLVGEEAVSAETNETDAGRGTTDSPKDWSFLLTNTVPDVVDSLQEIEDVDDLHAIQKQEEEGAARKGVLKAIDERIEELQNAG